LLAGLVVLVNAIKIVPEHKRLDVYRLGRYLGEKGPGLVLLLPTIDRGIMKELGEGEQALPSRRMVGVVGQAETSVYDNGQVRLLSGEVWDAVSRNPISPGQRVRVVRMILEVEEE
jgi:regulator of protease activity HflC (stomatin/prohibitin superfamily)